MKAICNGKFFGLKTMAPQISELFPKEFKIYVEPFCGHASTTPYAIKQHPSCIIHLNDLSDHSIDYCKRNFGSKAIITKKDYKLILKQYKDNENAFLLIDPPWKSRDHYIMTEKPREYYSNIIKILDNCKCKWMIIGAACNNKGKPRDSSTVALMSLQEKYNNIQIYYNGKKSIFGGKAGVRLIKNY